MNLNALRENILLRLKRNGMENPKLVVEYLISHILGVKRLELILHNGEELALEKINKINRVAKSLTKDKPLSWVLKSHNFCGLEIFIKEKVFIPRPETEELAEMVYEKSLEYEKLEILDFCAGSGSIGLYLAYKNKKAKVFAIEKMKTPYKVMLENKRKLALDNYFPALSSSIKYFKKKFDILVANPPYIPADQYDGLDPVVKKEPKTALIGGRDGLEIIRYIVKNIPYVVKNGGYIFLETGEYYREKLIEIFNVNYIKKFEIIKDINKKDRFVKAIYIK